MSIKDEGTSKDPNGTAGYGSPTMEMELLGIQIAHPTLGTDKMDPKMFLEAVRYHRIPVGGLLFALLTEVELARALYVNSLKGPGRKCELKAGGLTCSADGSQELPERPVMASEGPMGRGTSCKGTTSSLGALEVQSVGTWWALFGTGPKGEGAHWPSIIDKEVLGWRRSWPASLLDPSWHQVH